MHPTFVRCSKPPAIPRFFKDSPLSLNHFLLRKQVISLYRQTMRCTKDLNKDDANEMKQWVRFEFERHRNETELDKIKALISSGKHQMHSIRASVSLAGSRR